MTNKTTQFNWPPKRIFNDFPKNESFIYKKNKHGYPIVVEQFENFIKNYFKVKFCLSLNSGTSALQAAFFCLRLKKKDEVIVPNITFHATVTPLLNYPSKIVFCDSEEETGNICIKDLEKKITSKTKAVVITHLCGHACDMNKIIQLKKKYKFTLIEDCSHSHLSKYNGKLLGTFGDLSIFSMDTNKILSTGEGGFLLTNNKNYFIQSLLTSDFGARLSSNLPKKILNDFGDTGLGFKHRIHPYSAFIGLREFKKLKKYIRHRHKKLNYLSIKISECVGLKPPSTKNYADRGAYYSYRPFFDKKKYSNLTLNKFINLVNKSGLDIRKSGNKPLHMLPIFRKNKKCIIKEKSLICSKTFYMNTFSLPTFTFEGYDLIDKYIKVFQKIENKYAKKNPK